MQKYIDKMTGYKGTDANMRCQGFQFELGKWYEIEGEIALCEKGFHFCVHPSGPWFFYNQSNSRRFKVEAEQVLDLPVEPGADYKLVCKRIRLVEEIFVGGNWNTGNWNTGNWNTGDWNTGNWNTGNWNTTNRSAGVFCAKEPKVISFDIQTKFTMEQFLEKYPEAHQLGELLSEPAAIPFAQFKNIPGITKKKLATLHQAYLKAREKK